MLQMEGSVKSPQISEMFQKFALAFKTKTIEFFGEGDEETAAGDETDIDICLLDSSDEVITDQKVVVIKADQGAAQKTPGNFDNHTPTFQTLDTLISSLFATISSFKSSYLHLQTAHAPFDTENIEAADRAAVSHLQRLSQIKRLCKNGFQNYNPSLDSPLSSHLEAQVQENQNLLRTFDTIINRMQSDIDRKDAEAAVLRQRLETIERSNLRMEKRLDSYENSSPEVLLSVDLFDSVLQDVCRAAHSFTKMLIDLMKIAGWDLSSAAKSVHPNVEYAKRGHNQYAFLSYVCLGMLGGFSSANFGLDGEKIESGSPNFGIKRKKFLMQFIEHGSVDAMELVSSSPECDFARFCEKKYQQLIHPSMESSLFGNLNQRELELDNWRSTTPLYESFVNMASSVWMLHKLAFSFDPVVGIFQVETGADFSLVYMQNVIRRGILPNLDVGKMRAKVGFTVIPGFRVGKTVIQCQVYLNGMKCVE